MKRKAVSDALGAVFLIMIIFASAVAIMVSVANYLFMKENYNAVMEVESNFNKQNITVYFVQHLPPSGNPGIVVTNYGIPVTITYLVIDNNGSLSFEAQNKYLPYGATAYFYTNNPDSGVLTSFGALFMANSSTALIPVSKIAINTTVYFPPQLEYVTPGYYSTSAPHAVKWFVNGTYVHSGKRLTLYIDGPTSITAVPVNSHP